MKDKILSRLPAGHPWRANLHYYPSLPSTNDLAKTMARQGAPEGTVIIAGHQTGGRGRMGRRFHSPEGAGIYMSVILRPCCRPEELMHLTCAAAEAMCDAVQASHAVRPMIKWINDLVCSGKKLGGILTELVFAPGGTLEAAVVGIGINCLQKTGDFPEELRGIACSLSMVTGNEADPAALAAAMVEALHTMSTGLLSDRKMLLSRYRKDCLTIGQEVQILRSDSCVSARALDVDDWGALVVLLPDGTTETVNSGEVSVRGLYGYV